MNVIQIYSLVNDIYSEITVNTDLLKEDLTNTIEVGKKIINESDKDNKKKTIKKKEKKKKKNS